MINATLYSDFSSMQHSTAEESFRELLSLFDLPGGPSLIDVGCGPGDFLVNRIISFLHSKPSKVVGIDISKTMVELANAKYGSKNISFHEFDIQAELTKSCEFREPKGYDLVTSFYCYNWIRDERYAHLKKILIK